LSAARGDPERIQTEPSICIDAIFRHGAPQNTSTKALKPAARPARHIPARVRRTVVDRDGACCTHVDPTGQRCRETHHLELHHLVPFASGGGHTAANLTLRCAAHNAYAAELDFSSEHIAMRRDSCPHESAKHAEREAKPRAG
jgi:hypothetical protein